MKTLSALYPIFPTPTPPPSPLPVRPSDGHRSIQNQGEDPRLNFAHRHTREPRSPDRDRGTPDAPHSDERQGMRSRLDYPSSRRSLPLRLRRAVSACIDGSWCPDDVAEITPQVKNLCRRLAVLGFGVAHRERETAFLPNAGRGLDFSMVTVTVGTNAIPTLEQVLSRDRRLRWSILARGGVCIIQIPSHSAEAR